MTNEELINNFLRLEFRVRLQAKMIEELKATIGSSDANLDLIRKRIKDDMQKEFPEYNLDEIIDPLVM